MCYSASEYFHGVDRIKGTGRKGREGEKRGAKQEEVLKGGKEGLEERIEREVERTWR